MQFTDYSPITDLDHLSNDLNEKGVAVLPNVFQADECDNFRKKVWDHMCSKHAIKNTKEYFEKIRPFSGGLIHGYGVSLYTEVLDLKTDERCVAPFKCIWNENELTCSLDGMYIGPPAEESGYFFDPDRLIHSESFHSDQSSNKKEKCCVQSFITLEDIETGDGCLSVLTNSHKYHAEFFQYFNINTYENDWFVLNREHLDWFVNEKGCKWNTILAPKGSMVFWDSRTIHMATLPRRDRPNKNRWRFLVYVCYTPANLQSEEDSELKKNAYIQNQVTAHWPYSVHVFCKRSDDKTTNSLNNLTERHKKLIGI